MNNKIKNYFQRLYNETGVKPFTFFNVFLFPVLPVVLAIVVESTDMGIALPIIALIAGLAFNIAKTIIKFPTEAVKILPLMFLATMAFTIKFFVWPIIKFAYYSGKAATAANMGNYSESQYYSGQHSGMAMSAFNWFQYDGKTYKDEADYNSYGEMPAYAADEGSYSYKQNDAAHAMGYVNGKEAEMNGRVWNEQRQVWA